MSVFKASSSWLYRFKKHFKIVSRKVTSFVTNRKICDTVQHNAIIQDFRRECKDIMTTFSDDQIYNADECGFNKEMPMGRTLEIKGTPDVHGKVQSKGATTHSYTIMPIISRSGKLIPKLFVILHEPAGISARVQEKMFKADNCIVKWCSSGYLLHF